MHSRIVIPTGAKRRDLRFSQVHTLSLGRPGSKFCAMGARSRVPEGRHIALAGIGSKPLEQQIVDKPGSAHTRGDRHQATGSDIRYILERLRVDNPEEFHLEPGFFLENALSLTKQLA